MSQSRRAIAPILLIAAYSSLGLGCRTEVESITPLKVSLKYEPGLSPLWLSNDLMGSDGGTVAPLDVYIDGQPALPVDTSGNESAAADAGFSPKSGVTVTASEFLVTLFVSGGVHDIGFMRNGELVSVAEHVDLAADRFNYVIAYGSNSEPAVDVITDRPASEPKGSRRIRIVNMRPDRSAAAFELIDGAGAPISELSATLAYGEVYSRSVPNSVSEIKIADAAHPTSAHFTCGHTELLVFDGGPSVPFMPVPVDPAANFGACATVNCSCPAP